MFKFPRMAFPVLPYLPLLPQLPPPSRALAQQVSPLVMILHDPFQHPSLCSRSLLSPQCLPFSLPPLILPTSSVKPAVSALTPLCSQATFLSFPQCPSLSKGLGRPCHQHKQLLKRRTSDFGPGQGRSQLLSSRGSGKARPGEQSCLQLSPWPKELSLLLQIRHQFARVIVC